MNETLQIIQLVFSFLIIPVLTYVVRLERRLTKVETLVEVMYRNIHKRGGENK